MRPINKKTTVVDEFPPFNAKFSWLKNSTLPCTIGTCTKDNSLSSYEFSYLQPVD